MIVHYRRMQGVVVEFNPNETPEALVFVRAIQRATDSADVQRVVNAIELDLSTGEPQEVHICEQCCTPIYTHQLAIIKGDRRVHAQCPPMKPESVRDIH